MTTVRKALLIGLVALVACGAGSSSSTKVRAAACRTSQLRGSLENFDAGAGQRYVTLVLMNVSAFRCSVLGYPSLELIGADGEAIPTATVRSTPGSTNRLTVASGRSVSSVLHWIGIPLSDEQQTGLCEPAPSRIDVTPLGDPQTLAVDWSFGPVCGHGRIDNGPLKAGLPPN